MTKLHLSNSSLQMFKTCKRKYKYRYVDRIDPSEAVVSKYLSFGQSIHKTLAKYNRIRNEDEKKLDVLHNLLRNNWIREGYQDRDEERDFGLRGLKILTNYYYDPLDKAKKVLMTEQMIKRDMDGEFILCGVLDKGYVREDGKLEITDYKTGSNIVHSEDFTIDLQLPIYVLLFEEIMRQYPSTVSYYYLVHKKKIEREITPSNVKQIIEYIWSLYEEVANEDEFPCSPTSYCATSCEYADICEGARNDDSNTDISKELEKLKVIDISKYLF